MNKNVKMLNAEDLQNVTGGDYLDDFMNWNDYTWEEWQNYDKFGYPEGEIIVLG